MPGETGNQNKKKKRDACVDLIFCTKNVILNKKKVLIKLAKSDLVNG